MSTLSQESAEAYRTTELPPDAIVQNDAPSAGAAHKPESQTSLGTPISEWNPGRLVPVPLPETTPEECLEIGRRIRQVEEERQ